MRAYSCRPVKKPRRTITASRRASCDASASLMARVSLLCAEQGSLLVVDEIFTGFHRTGPAFLHQELEVTPDIVLVGKAMGNGFPVSGVVLDRRYGQAAVNQERYGRRISAPNISPLAKPWLQLWAGP